MQYVALVAPARPPVRRLAVPVALALLASATMVALLLYGAATRSDSVAFDRQEQLVSQVLDQRVVKLASEQESQTLKDTAVTMLTPSSFDAKILSQMDRNWGPWFHRYYGHDETYLLRGNNAPFYAMRDGRRVHSSSFETLRTVAEPVVAQLRAETRKIPVGSQVTRSPHTFDFVEVNGHPAIVSVKPVISQNGIHVQTPGREIVHISIVRLDGRLIAELSQKYLFKDARFSRVDDHSAHEAIRPFVSPRTGHVIGYFIWRPYSPGSIVLKEMSVPLLLTLLLIGLMVWLLIRRIKRSTADLQVSEAQAKHLAFHDVLTGLANRALLEDRMDRALAAARRFPEQQCALLCLDLDRFKKVNDTLGHPAGDQLLCEVADRLTTVVRETDSVARLGGDEFAIIQAGKTSQQDIDVLCQRLVDAVSQPFDIIGNQVFVGVSIGVARSGVDSYDRSELARKGDIALYQAKAEGRGRYAIFTPEMDDCIQIRQGLERDLRAALDEGGELLVYYQPLFDLELQRVSGMEALVRWQHPRHGLMLPVTFIPMAEETGLVVRLGEWVLEQSCLQGARWPIGTMSVNVSAVQLRNPLFAQRVLDILARTGLDPARLELEITETAFLESVGHHEANIKTLRAAGIRIALDDFGTGYSSLTHLRQFEVDRIKIDRSFVVGIGEEAGSCEIVQAIIGLARSMGLRTTAAGVETMEQGQFLSSAGCNTMQGHLMSPALPSHQIDGLFKAPSAALPSEGWSLDAWVQWWRPGAELALYQVHKGRTAGASTGSSAIASVGLP